MAKANKRPSAEAVQNSVAQVPLGFNGAAILTKQQAAELLGCTTRYVERQIRAGRLRACKPTGKLVRIYRRDLDAFLETGSTIGGGE
jgi:excisionase family DNA binding protein